MVHADEALVPRGHLFVCSGPDTGATLGLAGEETTLGRSSDCDIQVDDGRASSAHARILRGNGHHVLLDLGSTNGTFVNSRRIEEVILQPGDVIQLGETLLEYRSEEEGSAEVSSSALAFPNRYQSPGIGEVPTGPGDGRFAGHNLGQLPGGPAPAYAPGPVTPDAEDLPIDFVALFERLQRMGKLFALKWYFFVGLSALCAVLGMVWHHFDPGPRKAIFTISLVPTANDTLSGTFNRGNNLVFFREAEKNFKSERLIRRTLGDMGTENPDKGFVQVVQDILLEFSREGDMRSNVFSGSFAADDGEYAVRWLEKHLQNYLDTELEKALRMVKTSERYFASELERSEVQASEIEAKLVAFRRDNADAVSNRQTSLYDDLYSKKERLQEVRRLIAQEERALEVEQAKLGSTPKFDKSETLTVNPYLPQLAEIESALASAKAAGKGPRHPEVVELNNRLAQVKRLSDQSGAGGSTGETRMTLNPMYVRTRDEIGRLQTLVARYKQEAASLEADIAASSDEVDVLPQQEANYKELLASHKRVKDEVDRLSFKLKEARQQVELERSSAEARYDMITEPTLEYVDEKKRTQQAGIKGMIVGFATAFVLVSYLLVRGGLITMKMLTTIPRKQPRMA
ncbi:MAG: FHA domain-containing protein [Myxococcota bacterium]